MCLRAHAGHRNQANNNASSPTRVHTRRRSDSQIPAVDDNYAEDGLLSGMMDINGRANDMPPTRPEHPADVEDFAPPAGANAPMQIQFVLPADAPMISELCADPANSRQPRSHTARLVSASEQLVAPRGVS